MGKNIRRGRTGSVRCSSCGQITRRDRAVYLFRDGIKSYYCPDCAKKIHGKKLYKGMPKYVKKIGTKRVRRKFTIFPTEDSNNSEMVSDSDVDESQINLSEEKEDYSENKDEVTEQNDDTQDQTDEQEESDDKEEISEENNSENDEQ